MRQAGDGDALVLQPVGDKMRRGLAVDGGAHGEDDFLHFRREDGVAENFHPEQNRELLTRLAGQTGGRYWTPDDVAGLPGEIRFSEAGITAWETLDLWDMPILFFLLFALKGAEWLRRRHWGVV